MLLSDRNPQLLGREPELKSDFLDPQYKMSASNPDVYEFSGNSYSIKVKGKQLTSEQLSRFRLINISISGTMIKNLNSCCYWNTVIWGSIFLFPLFFMCCDWWKKRVFKLHRIEQQAYEGAAQIIQNSSAQEFYLNVQDNYFNQSKAKLLIQGLKRSSVRNFIFTNAAMGFNTEINNYQEFDKYWRQAKSLHINLDISWAGKFLA